MINLIEFLQYLEFLCFLCLEFLACWEYGEMFAQWLQNNKKGRVNYDNDSK